MNKGCWVLGGLLFGALAVACSTERPRESVGTLSEELPTSQTHKLKATDPGPQDRFGNAVVLTPTELFVGSREDNIGASADRGSVYAFPRSGSTFGTAAKVVAPDGAAFDNFGTSIAISGDTLVIGASGDDTGSGFDQGSAYVFARSGAAWAMQQKLLSPTIANSEGFGGRVEIAGDVLAVGLYNAVQLFTRSGATWTPSQRLSHPGRLGFPALELSNDTLLVGFSCETPMTGQCSGAVYVYRKSGATFALDQRLVPLDAGLGDGFGNDVAMDGDLAVIGGNNRVYVFSHDASGWLQVARLTSSDGLASDLFGAPVAISGGVVLVGARLHEHGGQNGDAGAAYQFVRSGTGFVQDRELLASDWQNNDQFGSALAVLNDTVVVGAPNEDDVFQGMGSAYVFRILSGGNGQACTSSVDCLSGFCSDGRCCNSACNGPCDACAVGAGAAADGQCALVAAGSPGAPACAPLACTGTSAACSPCTGDASCPADRYCDAAGACQPQKDDGRACEPTAGDDCLVDGCRVCSGGTCSDGVCCSGSCTPPASACSAAPCENGGACTDTTDGYDCACRPGINGADCEVVFTEIVSGEQTCGLRSDGKIACWSEGASPPPPTGVFTDISAGPKHLCAVGAGGAVTCWGYGANTPPALSFVSVGAGNDHDCGVLAGGTLACWGANTGGQASPPSGTFQAVAAGAFHSCGIRTDGTVACWGLGGLDAEHDHGQTAPPAGTFSALSLYGNQSCGLTTAGAFVCWGEDAIGIAGLPFPGGPYLALAAGGGAGCAVRFDGVVVCTRPINGAEPPRGTQPPSIYRAVSVGLQHACAIRYDHVVRCWGIDMVESPQTGSL